MNELPEISFERSLTHSLMLLHHCSLPEDSFESKMLKHTQIPGTLPLSVRSAPEDPMLVYDITSLMSVESRYENRRIVWQDIAVLIDSLARLLRQLEAYLLPESYLSLDPRTLFLDPEKKLLLFALAPDASPDFQKSLTRLLAWVLERIDYSSDATVVLAYRLHKESCREYCSIADLQKLVRIHTEKARQQPTASPDEAEQAEAVQKDTAHKTLGLSPDGIFRYQPQGSSIETDSVNFAAEHSPSRSRSSYADAQKPSKAPAADFGSFMAEDTAVPKTPQAHDRRRYTEDTSSPLPKRPTPPPILGDDWAEDTADSPDYRFPASSLSETDINPEDYAIDMNEEADGNATGSLLSFFRLKKAHKKEKAASLKSRLQTQRSEHSLRTRLLLCVLFMLAMPTLVFFLKGPSLFRRLLPVILILEVGIAVLTALDCLMLRMPEEAEG